MEPRHRTIRWTDPNELIRAAEGRPGLALLRGIIAGELPQAPISALLDFRLVAADDGVARFEGDPFEAECNPMGQIHGGVACTLLDSAMSCAVMTTLDATSAYATAQLAVHLTRPIGVDTGRITAEGRVVHRGRRVATAEGWLRDRAGALLAHGTTTCLILAR
jgi:uncharacterized protein (TIGR00369 family)